MSSISLFRLVVFALLVGIAPIQPGRAQAAAPEAGRELLIGTKEAPPFAMKTADGTWHGMGIDLWSRIADHLHLRYRLVAFASVPDLVNAVQAGKLDAAVAAISVTSAREEKIDFTQPFFAAGLGVAIPRTGGLTAWLPLLRTFSSLRFLEGVLALLSVAVLVGILIWLFERRHNPPYGGHPARGLIAGMWWSAVAMTQAGAAHDGPRTPAGRILAVVWMVASVVTIAVFIAGISSTLTAQRLAGMVANISDLRSMRVGAVAGSSTIGYLDSVRVAHREFPDARTALKAVQAGQIDAVVYDRPILAWMVSNDFSSLAVPKVVFNAENYAIAVAQNDKLRLKIDVALLDIVSSEWWRTTQFHYLGRNSTAAE